MENKNGILIKGEKLNGCFGDLYISKIKRCLYCACKTADIESVADCPFFEKKIKLVNYAVQVEGFGLSGKYELGDILKKELEY